MNRLSPVLVGAVAVCAARTHAHACSVLGPSPYVIDASMQATDHVARPHPRGLAWVVAAALLLAGRRGSPRTR